MTYLLIAFVIFLALAPLSNFVPSKRQRKVARLREQAAVGGLFVEFRKPPPGVRLAPAREQSGEIIYYGRRLPPARQGSAGTGSWLRDDVGWRALEPRNPVPEQLQDLPPDVFAAAVDSGSCGVYWREAGDEVEVEIIRSALTAWAGDLRPAKGNFS